MSRAQASSTAKRILGGSAGFPFDSLQRRRLLKSKQGCSLIGVFVAELSCDFFFFFAMFEFNLLVRCSCYHVAFFCDGCVVNVDFCDERKISWKYLIASDLQIDDYQVAC
mmetsp:Transcript_15803/g.23947  ORF Transcript_15803/g.23947 Transcript_15803/m.23947 type:complete len:110 (-) Transcript_15803:10-339(-)